MPTYAALESYRRGRLSSTSIRSITALLSVNRYGLIRKYVRWGRNILVLIEVPMKLWSDLFRLTKIDSSMRYAARIDFVENGYRRRTIRAAPLWRARFLGLAAVPVGYRYEQKVKKRS